jgi:hypothetical protein
LTMLLLGAVAWLLRRAKPIAGSVTAGAIEPEKVSAWLTVLGGMAMCLAGMFFLVRGDCGWIAAFFTLLGAAAGGFMTPSLTSIHRVHWTEDHIEGPSRLFGPTLGVARTAIAWADLTRAGKTITSYWYVEAGDGRRVYWSYLYKGYGTLTDALRRRCPNLKLPADMG